NEDYKEVMQNQKEALEIQLVIVAPSKGQLQILTKCFLQLLSCVIVLICDAFMLLIINTYEVQIHILLHYQKSIAYSSVVKK
ncbi:hypothetical protein V1478_011501, partial [Vespula squamosa]